MGSGIKKTKFDCMADCSEVTYDEIRRFMNVVEEVSVVEHVLRKVGLWRVFTSTFIRVGGERHQKQEKAKQL